MSTGPVFLGQYSIINAGGSLLDAGRRINRSGIGMSANSRMLLESFYNGATALFNQLYTKTENGELNNVKQILALRSKYAHLVSDEVKAMVAEQDAKNNVPVSNTSGTQVNTQA